ncbi:hypothetical protein E8K88_01065 [Lampropedia aestuarii]|uniref:Lactonase family protein n=1 Tax=Lampropedia aestuarii TaxID=2562762 RepID=A0A4S5C233_9BURK|nr:hypothetical protein [Lampropedia aestuarii]THJ36518.1 hypothetical protein E8K88_01065 [Lampropedia aestuarii]
MLFHSKVPRARPPSQAPAALKLRRWGKMLKTAASHLGLALGLAASLYSSQAAAQETPFTCSSVYGVTNGGDLYSIDDQGNTEFVRSIGYAGVNPLGIGPGGRYAYIARQTTASGPQGSVIVYDSLLDEVSSSSAAPQLQPGMARFIAGAVNPVNGWFYIAAPNTAGNVFFLYAYNPDTPAIAAV